MSAQKSTKTNNQKRKSSAKSKNKVEFEKGKVYIPAYKMIVFCACVIAVCVTLLLISAIKANESPKNQKPAKENVKTEVVKSEKPQTQKQKADSVAIKPAGIPSEKKSDVKIEPPKKETEKKESAKTSPKSEVKTETKSEKKSEVKAEQKIEKKTEKKAEVKSEQKSEPTKENKTEKKLELKSEPVKTDSIKTEPERTEKKASEVQQTPVPPKTVKKAIDIPPAKNNAQLVFVFDDGGQNLNHLDKFLKLPFPCTIAVLPRITHSVESAKRIRASKHELILHQPMQSVNPNVNPGPGAITPDMTEEQIKSTLFQNITEIGPIAGMNNHEGSGITADAEKMEVVLKAASEDGIYFLDSRTNVETKVPYVAKEMGYSYYERNIFLDNEKTRENILSELKKGIAIANKNGVVIMIGHVWSADILPGILEELYPELVEKGYTFKTVSECKGKK